MMRIAVLQHVEFEGPAAIADWAAARGFPLRIFHLHCDTALPLLSDFDMLTVMGGPMSANDEARIGWLGPEIALVREAIAADKTVLGICLGAQIIAKALGARVYPGNVKEIGWFPVQPTGSHPFFDGLPDSFTPFHWHGETFDLPREATLLAKSKITKTQAFAVGQCVLGLQFHLEATEQSARALLKGAAHEIGHGVFEQQPGTVLSSLHHCASLRPLLDTALDRLTVPDIGLARPLDLHSENRRAAPPFERAVSKVERISGWRLSGDLPDQVPRKRQHGPRGSLDQGDLAIMRESLYGEFRQSVPDRRRYGRATMARPPDTAWVWAFGIFDPAGPLGASSSTSPKLPLAERVARRAETRSVSPLSAIRRIVAAIRLRRARARSRHELRELSDHLLKDIGLRREDVAYEFPQPFWYRGLSRP